MHLPILFFLVLLVSGKVISQLVMPLSIPFTGPALSTLTTTLTTTGNVMVMPQHPNSSTKSTSASTSTEDHSTITITVVSVTGGSHSCLATTSSLQAATITGVKIMHSSTLSLTTISPQNTTNNQTSAQPSPLPLSTQNLTSTTPGFPNASTSVILTTQSMSISSRPPTSTFTSIVTANATPPTTSVDSTTTPKPSLAGNSGTSLGGRISFVSLLIGLVGVVGWTNMYYSI